MTTPAELATSPSRTDLLLAEETRKLADVLYVAVQDLIGGLQDKDRVAAWNGMLRVSWSAQLLEKRLKVHVVLGD